MIPVVTVEETTPRDCPNPQDKFCVSCKANDHASWDRRCLEFLRRIERLDQNLPENALKYFPTDESWTVSMSQIRVKHKQTVPTQIAIASLPPPATRGNRVQTTRNITKANARKPTGQKEEGQATLDEYVAKENTQADEAKSSQETDKMYNLRPRAQPIHSKQMEMEQAKLESEEETLEQLDTAFMEE